jgi:hypothetical protein
MCVRERVSEGERARARERREFIKNETPHCMERKRAFLVCVFFVGVSAGAWADTNSIHLEFIVGGQLRQLPPPHAPH